MHTSKIVATTAFALFFTSTLAMSKTAPLNYHMSTQRSGGVSYTFTDVSKPELILEKGKICDTESINETLKQLNIPEITDGVQAKSQLTGHRSHRQKFVWENHPLGTLTIVSAQCNSQADPYNCIWQVKITN